MKRHKSNRTCSSPGRPLCYVQPLHHQCLPPPRRDRVRMQRGGPQGVQHAQGDAQAGGVGEDVGRRGQDRDRCGRQGRGCQHEAPAQGARWAGGALKRKQARRGPGVVVAPARQVSAERVFYLSTCARRLRQPGGCGSDGPPLPPPPGGGGGFQGGPPPPPVAATTAVSLARAPGTRGGVLGGGRAATTWVLHPSRSGGGRLAASRCPIADPSLPAAAMRGPGAVSRPSRAR